MQIYIRRNNEDFGPYSREAVLEYVKQGVFRSLDKACYAGMSEWMTLGELLGIPGASRQPAGSRPGRSSHITEFNPSGVPSAPAQAQPGRGGAKKGLMIVLNVALILIVAAVTYIRLGGGDSVARRYLAELSAGLAGLANEGPAAAATPGPLFAKAQPAPPAAMPTPATTPAPVSSSAPASTPAPANAPPPAASTPSTPSTAMVAESTPVPDEDSAPVLAASATPAPAATAPQPPSTPAPPKPFDPADLASNPAAWPKSLRLKQAVVFPAIYNSQVVGSVTAPPGAVVKLVSIQGDRLTVDFQGGTQQLFWRLTDLEEEAAKAAAPMAPAPAVLSAPATAATPAPVAPDGATSEPPSDN